MPPTQIIYRAISRATLERLRGEARASLEAAGAAGVIAPELAGAASRLSTNDALNGLVWRCITRARGLAKLTPDGDTCLGFATNARKRIEPNIPETYFGNVNFYGIGRCEVAVPELSVSSNYHFTCRLTVKELVEGPLGVGAARIRLSVERMTSDHCMKALQVSELSVGIG
jgi:hypothetical protein